jgi:hypothetical protein
MDNTTYTKLIMGADNFIIAKLQNKTEVIIVINSNTVLGLIYNNNGTVVDNKQDAETLIKEYNATRDERTPPIHYWR